MSKIKIEPTPLEGAMLLTGFRASDARGDFVKQIDDDLVERLGFQVRDIFHSTNKKGVIRGLHYQKPNPQAKIVFCIKGRIYDVIVDLRRNSPTFQRWHAVELSEKNNCGIYAPKGFAHGFCALEDGTCVIYFADEKYSPDGDRGIHFMDKELGIDWPIKAKQILSERDSRLPVLKDAELF